MGRRKKIIVRIVCILLAAAGLLSGVIIGSGGSGSGGSLYIIPIRGVIDWGAAGFVNRALREAARANARAVIVEIDTPGGRLDAVIDISARMLASPVPVISFVTREATSAGVLITISARKGVVMAPGSTIGAAEPRPLDEKVLSYWKSRLRAAAEATGRDPRLVEAMADARIEIEGVVERGRILSLTAEEAVDLKLADHLLATREAVLRLYDLEQYQVVVIYPAFFEHVASWVTHPTISALLFSFGSLAITTAIMTGSWAITAPIGAVALLLFFGGHLFAGLVGWEILLLIIASIALLIAELFVPGGILGVLGTGGIIASIIMAAPSPGYGAIYLGAGFVVSVIGAIVAVKVMGRGSRLFGRFVLQHEESVDSGYTAVPERSDLVGMIGRVITPLRPAGTAEFGDSRVDVVTDGEFIDKGTEIEVRKVEGTRVIVRRVRQKD
ncbi:nodulation protein NfeD [Candidatus Acetothermia bacterium]|nr:nodulation protein NfeD [Candidatus Acetothermia bacterium]